MIDYKLIQPGDKVRFSLQRDRLRPHDIEYREGVAMCETVNGWKVDICTDGGPANPYHVSEKNYISHRTGVNHAVG